MSRRFLSLVSILIVLAVLSLVFASRIKAGATQLWAVLHPAAVQSGTLTIGTDSGSYEVSNVYPARAPVDTDDLHDHVARVDALMARMPRFGQAVMPTGVRWVRFRPNWFLDTAMATPSGQIWVTVWPKIEESHPPEYLGQLYGGNLHLFRLPDEPYYALTLDYNLAPVPSVNGLSSATGRMLYWAILQNGTVVDSRSLSPNMRGLRYQSPTCKQGSSNGSIALYGQLANGRWVPILTWRAWQTATLGLWRYDPNYPLECEGRFAGYFWVIYEVAGSGSIYRVSNGNIAPVTSGRPYLVTDHAMILAGENDQIIEAHYP